jgi:hypothetical protein
MARRSAVNPPASFEVEPAQTTPRYVRDKVVAPIIGTTVSYLQKDRRQPNPQIPVLWIGDKPVYHLPTVFAALEAKQKGGKK